MDSEKISNYNNFENFIKLQKEGNGSFLIGNVSACVFKLDEMFLFFNDHFEQFYHKDNFPIILTFVHRCIKMWICRGDYLEEDVGIMMVNLLTDHSKDDNETNIVLQIIYQIMNSITTFGKNDVPISEKLIRALIATVSLTECRTSTSNSIACIHKYMEIFPESLKNLETLWSDLRHKIEINLKNGLVKEINIHILIQLFDDFKSLQPNFCDEHIIIATTQHLLKSDQRNFRKCGYYLLRKLVQYFTENMNAVARMWMSSDHNQEIERTWTMYTAMLENLEEEQSHLILPSLENLREIIKNKHLPSSWLNILYIKMLTHKNKLVLRWSIVFFLKTFSYSELSKETLKYLLQATNSNSLYNYEGYFLESDHFNSFLEGDITNLLTTFCEIENWKSLPLYMWLENLGNGQLPKSLAFEQILNISSSVRKLQNYIIREKAIAKFNVLFKVYIEKMSLNEYVTYVESIYNPSDQYVDHEKFYSKISSFIQSNEPSIFTQRFFEIFTNFCYNNDDLLSFLNHIPVEQHGWLKFAPFKFQLSKFQQRHIQVLYKLDLNSLASSDLQDVIYAFKKCLIDSSSTDKNELTACTQAAMSFYIYKIPSYDIEYEDKLRFILNSGIKHSHVLITLAEKLFLHLHKKIDLWLIDQFLKCNSTGIFRIVFNYLQRIGDIELIKKYILIVLRKYGFDSDLGLHPEINILKELTDEFITRMPSQGDKRIEEAFIYHHLGNKRSITIAMKFIDNQFLLDLLKYHTDITTKKPRYFENSYEHRVKLRIVSCMHKPKNGYNMDILDQIWNILLTENNQLNVTYIYEHILGMNESREDVILKKLKEVQNLTSSQQVSIMTVVYTYCQTKPTKEDLKNTIVYTLLSLTMVANFQTRLFAQMFLHQLLNNKFKRTVHWQQIVQSIENAAGEKLEEYLSDIRLNLSLFTIPEIHYITNVPFDEVFVPFWSFSISESKKKLIEASHQRFLRKYELKKNEETTPEDRINDQVQRKNNPADDLTEPHNLITFPIEERSEKMIVVASLIDKIPNLGGIARTCEVLGIRNLVMDSKMHTEKRDFKNLSMMAEKNINILEVKSKNLEEFLMLKKLEGYSIVGAEQTSKSHDFKDFQFPPKSILLLGHEKDGIPPQLLGLLDNAVEIPQFGQIRSLNVHVTGALFMWEYCKQHLLPK